MSLLQVELENTASFCLCISHSCSQLSSFANGDPLVLLGKRYTKPERSKGCDLQATTAGMLTGTKVLTDTKHIALFRAL